MRFFFTFLVIFFSYYNAKIIAQEKEPKWDSTSDGSWGKEFSVVEIPSSVDGKIQKAYYHCSQNKKPQPLIVSLHTWSGNYKQEDPLIKEIILKDYNYIHPDFRGANNNPEACGSSLVIADIEDAIQYAITNGNVNPDEVHVIGTSGGGYATLLAYMKITYPVKSFSAWVPISNLEDWYWESVGRNQRYAKDIMLATKSTDSLNVMEARKRSPYYQVYNDKLRDGAQLFICTGIHDGYKGSVPITQSINMYNKLVRESLPENEWNLISQEDIINLLSKRCFPSLSNKKIRIGNRSIHYMKQTHKISLLIFEGGHEQIVERAISLALKGVSGNLSYGM